MNPPSQKWVEDRMAALKGRFDRMVGREFTQDDLRDMTAAVLLEAKPKVYKYSDDQLTAALGTLEHLVGGTHSKATLNNNVLRILANWHFIRDGMEVPMWDGNAEDMSMVVIGVRQMQPGAYGPRHMLLVKMKSGLAAGIIQCAVVNDSVIYGFIDHSSGTAKMNCPAEEIAGMRMSAVVEARPDGSVKLSNLNANQAMRWHNKDLAERRQDPAKCPNPVPCNVCSKTVRECPLAVWLPKEEGQ